MITPVNSAKNPSSPTEESKFRLLVRVNYSFTVLSHTSMQTKVWELLVMQVSLLYLQVIIGSLVMWLYLTCSLYSWSTGQVDRKLLDTVCSNVTVHWVTYWYRGVYLSWVNTETEVNAMRYKLPLRFAFCPIVFCSVDWFFFCVNENVCFKYSLS